MKDKKEEINYQNAVAIDPDKLDEEIFSQPGLYMNFSELYAKTEKRRELLRKQLDILEAELDKKIRTNPKKFELEGIKTITETIVKNTIQRQEQVQFINKKLINYNFELKLLSSALTALEHKKRMLEKAVDLYNGQYFTPTKTPHTIKGGKRIYYENINRQIINKLNKKGGKIE